MTFTNHSYKKMNRPSYISDLQRQKIYAFIQSLVYDWCKNRKGDWFAMRDLVGGTNNDWNGTPFQCLYDKHINNGKSKDEAHKEAGIDSGYLLKDVLHEDKREFECDNSSQWAKKYSWTGK